jgi:Tol biopolymer transport system component
VGSETSDSDIFAMNVNDCLDVIARNHVDDCREIAGPHVKNLTNNGSATIDDDPDWSPDGRKIVYVRHAAQTTNQFAPDAEIYVMRVDSDGTPVQENPQRLTFNSAPPVLDQDKIEERGPAWSPDGRHIAYACRLGALPPGQGGNTFKICVMDADGNHQVTLTNGTSEFTPTWSPDGKQIVFHGGNNPSQLFILYLRFDQDGAITGGTPQQLTFGSSANGIASWGMVRTK